jgi:hypothetical protein
MANSKEAIKYRVWSNQEKVLLAGQSKQILRLFLHRFQEAYLRQYSKSSSQSAPPGRIGIIVENGFFRSSGRVELRRLGEDCSKNRGLN